MSDENFGEFVTSDGYEHLEKETNEMWQTIICHICQEQGTYLGVKLSMIVPKEVVALPEIRELVQQAMDAIYINIFYFNLATKGVPPDKLDEVMINFMDRSKQGAMDVKKKFKQKQIRKLLGIDEKDNPNNGN